MAKKWIEGAIDQPGALRAEAMHEGLLHKGQTLSKSDLDKLAAHAAATGNETLAHRVHFAKELRQL